MIISIRNFIKFSIAILTLLLITYYGGPNLVYIALYAVLVALCMNLRLKLKYIVLPMLIVLTSLILGGYETSIPIIVGILVGLGLRYGGYLSLLLLVIAFSLITSLVYVHDILYILVAVLLANMIVMHSLLNLYGELHRRLVISLIFSLMIIGVGVFLTWLVPRASPLIIMGCIAIAVVYSLGRATRV